MAAGAETTLINTTGLGIDYEKLLKSSPSELKGEERICGKSKEGWRVQSDK